MTIPDDHSCLNLMLKWTNKSDLNGHADVNIPDLLTTAGQYF